MEEERMTFRLDLQLFGDDGDDGELLAEEDLEEEESEADTDAEAGNTGDSESTEKKPQSKEERALNAQRRRERERKKREEREKAIRDEAFTKGKLASIESNPYTNDRIQDEYDLKIYELQKKIDDEGGDPINDLPSRLARMDREAQAEKKAKEEAEAKKNEAIDSDIRNFKAKFPDIDAKALMKDENFSDYAEGKLGNKPLSEIYEGYQKRFGSLIEGKKKTELEEAKKRSSAPSSGGGQRSEPKSYSQMSKEERIAYLRSQNLIR